MKLQPHFRFYFNLVYLIGPDGKLLSRMTEYYVFTLSAQSEITHDIHGVSEKQ